jgi:hypothetical protein
MAFSALDRILAQAQAAGVIPAAGAPGTFAPGATINYPKFTMNGSPEIAMLQQEQARQAAMTGMPFAPTPFIPGQGANGAIAPPSPMTGFNSIAQRMMPLIMNSQPKPFTPGMTMGKGSANTPPPTVPPWAQRLNNIGLMGGGGLPNGGDIPYDGA